MFPFVLGRSQCVPSFPGHLWCAPSFSGVPFVPGRYITGSRASSVNLPGPQTPFSACLPLSRQVSLTPIPLLVPTSAPIPGCSSATDATLFRCPPVCLFTELSSWLVTSPLCVRCSQLLCWCFNPVCLWLCGSTFYLLLRERSMSPCFLQVLVRRCWPIRLPYSEDCSMMDGAETPSRNSDLFIFQRLIHIFLQLKHTYLGGEVWVMIHQPLMTSCCFETNGVVLPSQCGNNMLKGCLVLLL